MKYLAVADYDNQIVILDSSYRVVSTIEDGLNDPGCVFYDNRGNLYASNTLGGNVTEYNPAGKLTFTYAGGLSEPGCVTADSNRNVYVTDFNHDQPGVIQEYAQRGSSPLHSCMTGLANGGVAVDSKGDVFVTGNNPKIYAANILEYKGGLHACRAKTLFDTLDFGMGIQRDNKDDLVAADQNCCIEILPRPYDRITKIINGAYIPINLALSKSNKLIFIVDDGSGGILVATFPQGKFVRTLGSQEGISLAQGVATFP